MVKFIFSLLFICLSANATYSPTANIHDSSGNNLNSTSNALNVDVTNFPGSQTVTGTVAATQSGTWNLGNISGTITLPTGAATSAKQPALGTAGSASTDVLSIQGIASMTALKVDGSAVTQPVSGTFFQATQPVSASSLPLPSGASTSAKQPALGTAGSASADVISVQGVASMTALKVDGSAVTQPVSGTFFQVTQPVSASALPLPTGASTSVKQPALGTAGTPSSDVITVQGATSMTALKVDGSAVTQPISASSLPLPTGAATSANQTTASSSLSSIDTKTPALGQTTMSGSSPVTVASDQNYGSQSSGTVTGTGTFTVNTNGAANVTVYASDGGSYAGTTQLEASVDGTNYINIFGADIFNLDGQLYGSITTSPVLPRILQFNVAGFQKFRARALSSTGTLNLSFGLSPSPGILSSIQNFLFATSKTQDGSGSAIGGETHDSIRYLNVAQAGSEPATLTSTASGSGQDVFAALDVGAYKAISLQITGAFTATITFQASNDNFTTTQAVFCTLLTTINANPVGTAAAAGHYLCPVNAKYFRARITAFTSGSATGLAQLLGTIPYDLQQRSVNIQAGTVTTVSTVTSLTTLANGQTAHSSASTGSPVRVAGRVNTAVDTTLVQGDVSDLFMTSGGAAVMKPFAAPEVDWQYTSGLAGITNNTSTAMKAAGAAGVRNYVTGFSYINTSVTASTIAILDGASVIWSGNAPASMLTPVFIEFLTPLRGTAATAMNVQLTTTSTLTMVNANGYQAP